MNVSKIRSAKITIGPPDGQVLLLDESCTSLICSFELREQAKLFSPLIPVITILKLYDGTKALVRELEPKRNGTMSDTICLRKQSFELPGYFGSGFIEFNSLFIPAKNNLSKYIINHYLQASSLNYQVQHPAGSKWDFEGAQTYQWCDRRTTIWVRRAIPFERCATAQ